MTSKARDRARAAFIGGALGDALGMPTQLLSATEIAERYGFVESFVAPTDDHPVSRGLPAGTITDDTEQTILLARILLESPDAFDHERWVGALVDWERDVKARGSYDLLGPSTKRAIDAINEGVPPEKAGRWGDTNGAAMRIASVGILMPFGKREALVGKVAETCRATHNTPVAIASAAAVAAAISCGVSGGNWREAIAEGIAAAMSAWKEGRQEEGAPAGDMAILIEKACKGLDGRAGPDAVAYIAGSVGTSVAARESVPAAFAVLQAAQGDPWRAAVLGANLGGDTDTIGAIAAGMAGACTGMDALPESRVSELRGLDFAEVDAVASRLVTLREAASGGARAA